MFYDWCQDFYTESVRIKEQNQYLKRYTNQHRRRSKFFFRFQVRTHSPTHARFAPLAYSPLSFLPASGWLDMTFAGLRRSS